MSTVKVEVVEIEAVHPHTNADRLEVAKIKGWYCVVGKGQFKPGDRAVYFPIDSVLPKELEAKLFPPTSKITLSKGRVKTIKIRGMVSQGLLVTPEQVDMHYAPVGTDGTSALGVTKYEPELSTMPKNMMPTAKRHRNPHFKEYTDMENGKNFPTMFREDERVMATEKVHGTNFRCGWVPFLPETWWQKVKHYLFPTWSPKFEFVYGSRRVQLQKKLYNGFYAENVYGKMVTQYNLETTIPHGFVIYGEIYGDGIQKGYTYGMGHGEHAMVLFEVFDTQRGFYLTPSEVVEFARNTSLPLVPILYEGEFSMEKMKALTVGPSVIHSSQVIREGVVVRSHEEEESMYGRRILKFISDEYLLKDQTDFH